MLGLGLGEILLVGAVILVFVGPERLPHLFRSAGQLYAQVRRASDELRRAMVLEADRMDAEEQLQAAAQRRAAAEAQARAATAAGSVAQPREVFRPDESNADSPPAPLPEGVTAAEWEHLPPHVRATLLAAAPSAPPPAAPQPASPPEER